MEVCAVGSFRNPKNKPKIYRSRVNETKMYHAQANWGVSLIMPLPTCLSRNSLFDSHLQSKQPACQPTTQIISYLFAEVLLLIAMATIEGLDSRSMLCSVNETINQKMLPGSCLPPGSSSPILSTYTWRRTEFISIEWFHVQWTGRVDSRYWNCSTLAVCWHCFQLHKVCKLDYGKDFDLFQNTVTVNKDLDSANRSSFDIFQCNTS